MTDPVRLTVGVSDCDRLRALADGTAPIVGAAAEVTVMPLQPLFNLQLTQHPFDACEFPIATYLRLFDAPRRDYVGIPVFPSRHFRLSCVFVNRAEGLAKPSDLAGKRVGIPVWDMAAAVWLRGIFEEHYGLPSRAPTYVDAGLNDRRRGEDHPQFIPPGFTVDRVGDRASLSEMLESGEIDALYTARAPDSFFSSPDKVGRLFADPMAAELDFYRRTALLPPMHLMAVKRDLAKTNPGLPRTIFDACVESQRLARVRLHDSATLAVGLPWLVQHVEETERLLGPGFWSSGFRANRGMFATLIRYMRAEGLLAADLAPEDLFPPSLLET